MRINYFFFTVFMCFLFFPFSGECRWKQSDAIYIINKLAAESDEKERVLTKIRIGEEIQEDDSEFSSIPVREGLFSCLTVDGKAIDSPKNFQQLKVYLAKLDSYVNYPKTARKRVSFQYDGQSMLTIQRPFLARGKHAKVYDMYGSAERVFKLTIPTLAALRCVIEDNEKDAFWQKVEIENFRVPRRISDNSLIGGLYRVFEKSAGITLTKVLLAWNILVIQRSEGGGRDEVCVNWPLQSAEEMALFMPLQKVISKLLEIAKNNPENNISLAPNNLMIVFDTREAEANLFIKSVDLVDTGVSSGTKLKENKAIHDFQSYLAMSQRRLEKYLSDPIHEYDIKRLYEAEGKKELILHSVYKENTLKPDEVKY